MKIKEFFVITPTKEKTFKIRPVFEEMTPKDYEFDTECAAVAAKHTLDHRWHAKWDESPHDKLHYRDDAPRRLTTLHLCNVKGVSSRLTVTAQSRKAVKLGECWVPRRAMYQSGGLWFLRRWYIASLDSQDKRTLGQL